MPVAVNATDAKEYVGYDRLDNIHKQIATGFTDLRKQVVKEPRDLSSIPI